MSRMGMIITPSPVSPILCPRGDGVFWPTDCTPKYMYADISDIIACAYAPSEPPNGVYVLEHGLPYECCWYYVDGYFAILLSISGYNSYFSATSVLGNQAPFFEHDEVGLSIGPFLNDWQECTGYPTNYGKEGIVNCSPV